MTPRNRLPCRKLQADQTIARKAFGGIHHLKNSMMAAFAAVTTAMVKLSAMAATIAHGRPPRHA